MIKLLLADDEGIVLESLQRIVAKNFGDTCEVRKNFDRISQC